MAITVYTAPLGLPFILREPPDSPDAAQGPAITGNPWANPPLDPTVGPFPAPPRDRLPVNLTWDPGALSDVVDCRTDWDKLIVADGLETPGIASVEAHRGARIQRDSAAGVDGESPKHLGLRCTEVVVRIRLLTQGDLDRWWLIVPWLQAPAGKAKPQPVKVYHPALAPMGINALYVEDLGFPKSTSPGGPLEVTVRFVESVNAKSPVKTLDPRTRVEGIPSNPRARSAQPASPSAKPSSTSSGP